MAKDHIVLAWLFKDSCLYVVDVSGPVKFWEKDIGQGEFLGG